MSQYNSFKDRGLDRVPEHLKKRSIYRRRSSSSSSSEDSSESPRKTQDLYRDLKLSLEKNDQKEVLSIVKELSRTVKQDLGILRVSIGHTFEFHKNDIEEFFGRFGRIENVIIKESKPREHRDLLEKKTQECQNIAYIMFSQYYSAVVALKVLQSISQKDRIVNAKICFLDNSIIQEETFVPGLGQFPEADFIIEVDHEDDILKEADPYMYIGTIGIDLEDKHFCLKDRIIGVAGCNFLRIYYVCEKAARFQNEIQAEATDLKLKLIHNRTADTQREVLIVSNSLLKYNTAVRYAHELFEQIVEEYKNSREKSQLIIQKDIHIRRWERFKGEPTLKFLEPKST